MGWVYTIFLKVSWMNETDRQQADCSMRRSKGRNGFTPPWQGVARSILHRPRCDYLAHAVRLQRTHLARALHLLDHARRAVVTNLEPALHAGDGGAARLGDDLHGLIVQRVALGVAAVFAGIAAPAFAAIETLTVQYLVEIIRLALDLELLDDLVHLLIGDEGAMHAHGHAGAGRKIEHVAVPEQVFRALLVEDGARIATRRDLEGDARRDVGLDQTGDDVDRRPLRRKHEMEARGARLLREPRAELLDLLADQHHQVGELVDYDNDIIKVFQYEQFQ